MATLSLMQLVIRGGPELVGMAMRGELRGEPVWLALNGAAKYQEAIARGDVATEAVQRERVGPGGCLDCPHRRAKTRRIALWEVETHYCGEPLVGLETPRLCGCIIGITHNGEMVAAAKAIVGSSRCEAGRWP